jgi:hypothetical protein
MIVGHGQADKEQVAKMLSILVGRSDFATSDASDGLALAICHAHTLMGGGVAAGVSRKLIPSRSQKGNRKLSLAESIGISVQDVEGKTRFRVRSKE